MLCLKVVKNRHYVYYTLYTFFYLKASDNRYCNSITMLTSSGAVTFVHNKDLKLSCAGAPLFFVCCILLTHLNAQMSINSFVAHRENIHGKLSEVMKM